MSDVLIDGSTQDEMFDEDDRIDEAWQPSGAVSLSDSSGVQVVGYSPHLSPGPPLGNDASELTTAQFVLDGVFDDPSPSAVTRVKALAATAFGEFVARTGIEPDKIRVIDGQPGLSDV